MERDVLVSIRGMQTFPGDAEEENISSFVTSGRYAFRNGRHYITYKKNVEPSGEEQGATIRINENSVCIHSAGLFAGQLLLEEGKRTVSFCETGFANFQLGITTHSLSMDLGPHRWKIEAEYGADISNVDTGKHHIEILVEDKKGKGLISLDDDEPERNEK